MAKSKSRGLGRGLSALMADVGDAAETPPSVGTATVPVEKLRPNPDQPRREFSKDALDDLAASIAEKGIIQPLIVRKHPTSSDEYEIVAGERRWRAAQLAKLHEVPVVVRDLSDTEVLEVAIIENIQRADLNPIEEALGYQRLMDEFGRTQEKLGEALGKSRSHIANSLRLLSLPEKVQSMLEDGRLSAGHARALVNAPDAVSLAEQVVARQLSVRQIEDLMRKQKGTSTKKVSTPAKDADTVAIEKDLSAALGMRVGIAHKPDGEAGTLSVNYKTLEQLDELCRILSRPID